MPFDNRPVGTDGKSAADTRQMFQLKAFNFTAATTEAMFNSIAGTDGTDAAAANDYTIPNGKRLVLLGLYVATKNAGAAVQGVIVRVRLRASGAVVATDPVIGESGAGTGSATANIVASSLVQFSQSWPSLYEILGDGNKRIGLSQIGTATAGNDAILTGYLY